MKQSTNMIKSALLKFLSADADKNTKITVNGLTMTKTEAKKIIDRSVPQGDRLIAVKAYFVEATHEESSRYTWIDVNVK